MKRKCKCNFFGIEPDCNCECFDFELIPKTKYYVIEYEGKKRIVSTHASESALFIGPLYILRHFPECQHLLFVASLAYVMLIIVANVIYCSIYTTLLAHLFYGYVNYASGHEPFINFMKERTNAVVKGPFNSKKEAEFLSVLVE